MRIFRKLLFCLMFASLSLLTACGNGNPWPSSRLNELIPNKEIPVVQGADTCRFAESGTNWIWVVCEGIDENEFAAYRDDLVENGFVHDIGSYYVYTFENKNSIEINIAHHDEYLDVKITPIEYVEPSTNLPTNFKIVSNSTLTGETTIIRIGDTTYYETYNGSYTEKAYWYKSGLTWNCRRFNGETWITEQRLTEAVYYRAFNNYCSYFYYGKNPDAVANTFISEVNRTVLGVVCSVYDYNDGTYTYQYYYDPISTFAYRLVVYDANNEVYNTFETEVFDKTVTNFNGYDLPSAN